MIEPLRQLLASTGRPYVIENVVGAPLDNPVLLCGTMFGLRVFRHRLFETLPVLFVSPLHTRHPKGSKTNSFRHYSSFSNGATHISMAGHNFSRRDAALATGIDWMNREEMAQAIPPAYTQWIGEQLMRLFK